RCRRGTARALDRLDRGSRDLDDPDRHLPRERRQPAPPRIRRLRDRRSPQADRQAQRRLARRPLHRATQREGHVTARPLARALVAELIGTFALVFTGAGAVMVDAKTHALGHVGVALSFGLVIMVMIYAVGHISG